VAFSLSSDKAKIHDKIEENINNKINSMQFKSLKEDIFNKTDSNNYHNTAVLRMIILKSLQKKNITFASEVFEDMTRLNIVPDDATYTALMEFCLYQGDTEDAFELYIQAYLNKVVLDLEIFQSLFERLQKKDISYLHVAYNILKSQLVPTKFIYDHLVYVAQKAKATNFLKVIYEDLEKFGIKKIDSPRAFRDSRSYPSKKKKRTVFKTKVNKGNSPFVIIPFEVPNNRSGHKGAQKNDTYINSLLDELTYAVNQNKKGSSLFMEDSDEDDEEDSSDDSENEENSDDSDGHVDEDREGFTSDSESD